MAANRRRRRPNNHIDEDEAEKFGAFIDAARVELETINDNAREEALQEGRSDYYRLGDAEVACKMTVKIGRKKDGAERQREAEVTVDANFHRITYPGVDQAPFNALFGVIAPAEKRRKDIIQFLPDKSSDHIPILALGEDRFWVMDPERGTHHVVEFTFDDEVIVQPVHNLDELNELTMGMFKFLQRQIQTTYGG